MSGHSIGLADAIANLRAELSRARRAGEGTDIRFAAGEITVELAIEFSSSQEVGAAVKIFSIFDVGGKANASDIATHKITLKLRLADDGTPADQLIGSTVVPGRGIR
jgi:hypothetical protein